MAQFNDAGATAAGRASVRSLLRQYGFATHQVGDSFTRANKVVLVAVDHHFCGASENRKASERSSPRVSAVVHRVVGAFGHMILQA